MDNLKQAHDLLLPRLIFLSLPNVEMAIERVATRIAQAGHDVPEAVIRRKFEAGICNFNEIYKGLIDVWILYWGIIICNRKIKYDIRKKKGAFK